MELGCLYQCTHHHVTTVGSFASTTSNAPPPPLLINLSQQDEEGSDITAQTIEGRCAGNDFEFIELGFRVEGADGIRLWAATNEVVLLLPPPPLFFY